MVKVIRFIILVCISFGTWVVLSMDISLTALIFGTVFALLTALFLYGFLYDNRVPSPGGVFIRIDLLIVYFILLLIHSYQSTFQLIKMILTGNYSSGIVRIKTKVHSNLGKTVLANTISLIPGTISLWLKGDHIYVHWFNQTTTNSIKAKRLITGGFENLAKRIFG